MMHSHFAYKQSIIPLIKSNLFCKLKLIKFVSIKTRYGGTRAALCARNREEATCGLCDRVSKLIKRVRRGRHTLCEQASPFPLPLFSSASVDSLF